MTTRLSEIWRHPIKAVGRERVARAHMEPGQGVPGDRIWAIAHARARAEDGEWARCVNFIRAANAPALMAVTASLNETTEEVTLHHPDRTDVTLHPQRDAQDLIAWVAPLMAEGRPAPARVLRADRPMTDNGTAGVTIANRASHSAVEAQVGRALSVHRWRANLWVDGLPAWAEFDWLDREIRIGTARFRVYERAGRCRATESNPVTGTRDADTLGALREGWGHTDFAVMAEVTDAGEIFDGCEVAW